MFALGQRDRSSGECDERGIGNGIGEVAGVPVEVVVVAAVRLVDDDDDVAAVGEQWVVGARVAFFLVRPNFAGW